MERKINAFKVMFISMVGIIMNGCSASDMGLEEDLRINVGFGSSLIIQNDLDLLDHRQPIENIVRETLIMVNDVMPTPNLDVYVQNSSKDAIPEIGMGGFNPDENKIILSLDLNYDDLESSINSELGPILAHEIHHARRRRAIGYGNSLLEAMVSEGLADSFSMKLFDIDIPIWATALQGDELMFWLSRAQKSWKETPYDHAAWFFGRNSNIPRWTGYSIGYELVNKYLVSAQLKPSRAYKEPSDSFVPTN